MCASRRRATVVDGLPNGGYGRPDLLTGLARVIVKSGGLLSSSALRINPDGNIVINTGGPSPRCSRSSGKVANAIAPPASAAVKAQPDVASVPSSAATTVTLTTGGSRIQQHHKGFDARGWLDRDLRWQELRRAHRWTCVWLQ